MYRASIRLLWPVANSPLLHFRGSGYFRLVRGRNEL